VKLRFEWSQGEILRWVEAVADPGRAIALVAIHPATGQILERFPKASDVAKFLPWLRHLNAKGFGIYASANLLAPGARRRRKNDFPLATALYLDLDRDAEIAIARMRKILPIQTLEVETSPGKFQLLWRLEVPIARARAEEILRGLAHAFGGDPAATDVARLLRLPGFTNTKYAYRPPVETRAIGPRAHAETFEVYARGAQVWPPVLPVPTPIAAAVPPPELGGREDLLRAWRGENPYHWGRPATASERDLYLAQRLLRLFVPPVRIAQILAGSPNRARGRRKRDLPDYIARTIAKAFGSVV
jgi:hypothetical protein